MRRTRRLGAFVLVLFLVMTTTIVPAFAADGPELWDAYISNEKIDGKFVSWKENEKTLIEHYVTTIDTSFISSKFKSAAYDTDKKLTTSGDYYTAQQDDYQEDVVTKAGADGVTLYFTKSAYSKLSTLIKSQADSYKAKTGVSDIGNQLNLTPDIEGAAGTLDGIRDIASTIVGILVIVVTIGMTLFTALDLCYITMPVFRNKCDDMKQSGQGAMVRTDNKSGETKLRWVTDEAQYAVQQSVNSGTGKSPLMIYLGKRIGAFIAIGVVLFVLFTGNISILVNIVLNLISGLMNALAGFGA